MQANYFQTEKQEKKMLQAISQLPLSVKLQSDR
jgi:hypothetical protein